jgi:Fe2+ or Zn2+ uptake regulation protein
MTISLFVRLYCTRCGKQYNEEDEFANLLRETASENGWKYIKVENGSFWDFCPSCYEGYKNER